MRRFDARSRCDFSSPSARFTTARARARVHTHLRTPRIPATSTQTHHRVCSPRINVSLFVARGRVRWCDDISFSPSPSSGTLATSLATAPSNVVSKARMMSTRRVELKSASRFRASKRLRCCAMTPIARNSSSSSFGYDDGEKADKKAMMRKRKSSIVITRAYHQL